MGKQNVVTKQYMQDNARFADACNFYLFHGEQIIKPEDLEERDVTELVVPSGLKDTVAIEKVRDILKGCCIKTAEGITYLIVGIENQTDIHYAMVVRNMLYDALNYSTQVEACAKVHRQKKDLSGAEFLSGFAKDDTLNPVVTLTMYWNYGSWDGARSLHEMLHVANRDILEYVADYKLNLIIPDEIENFEMFQTELGSVLEFISDASSGERLEKALIEKEDRWSVLGKEELVLLNTCLDAKLELKSESGKGAEGSVCKGIEELAAKREARGREQGKAEGRIEGKIEGEECLNRLMHVLADKGYQLAEIFSMTADAEQRAKLYEKYGIA